ncbi:MAG TPA: hypothetical protein DCM71_24270, partial [Runella sp.]|nr:hypothetical protein [Runella sp.]
NVTANSAPTLTYGNASVNMGNATMVSPATGPSDNGSISTIVLQSVVPATAPATLTVDNVTGVVAVPNNVPAGVYTVTVRATDNCSSFTDATFTLTVQSPDYTITTTSNILTITDMSGNGETLEISQNGSNIRFNVTGRTYSINGGSPVAFNTTPAELVIAGLASIVVNTANGNDMIYVGAFTANLPSLTINGGTGDDKVTLSGDITFAANANLDLDLQNDDAVPGVDEVDITAPIKLIGTGAATIKVSKNVFIRDNLETVDGNLLVEANQQSTPTSGNFNGVFAFTLVQSTGSGSVTVKGKGGDAATTDQIGVRVKQIKGNTVNVIGDGGASTASGNSGVYISELITSTGGNVSVTGTGGGSGASSLNYGVYLASNSQMTAGGTGTVTVVGNGGVTTGGANVGVVVFDSGSQITSGGGDVTVTGKEGGGVGSPGIRATGAISTATNGGNLSLIANSIEVNGGGGSVSTNSASTLRLKPFTAGVQINLGSSSDPIGGPLSLFDAELDRMTTGSLIIGDATAGAISVSAAITRPTATNVQLISGGDINVSGGGFNTGGGTLLLGPGSASAAIKPTFNGTDVTTSTLTLGGDLNIAINGTTAGNGTGSTYSQLKVVGLVDLQGVNLVLSGAPTLVGGETFVIVDNNGTDAISGTFNNLAQGATLSNFLGSGQNATISYVGGSGNDVVISVINNVLCYADADGDGFGDPNNSRAFGGSCGTGYVADNTDCNDNSALEKPGQVWYKDSDNDGYAETGAATITQCLRPAGYKLATELQATSGDCNDNNAAIKPGATEICDGIDNNCNGSTDEGVTTRYYYDLDGDGYGEGYAFIDACAPSGLYTATVAGDCVADDANIYPGATEICDGKDNNCDGVTDEGFITRYFYDVDGDGYGQSVVFIDACAPSGLYRAASGRDCNDNDVKINPGATEVCNDIDDNCDGRTDEGFQIVRYYFDPDGDGFGESGAFRDICGPQGFYTATVGGDCNNDDNKVYPGAPELCDGKDNNCNGTTDEGVITTYYADVDQDGFGNPNVSQQACSPPSGYVTDNTDCNDGNALEKPGQVWYKDTDNDGYAQTGAATITQCLRPAGYKAATELSATSGDCNDANAAIKPGATEVCDGIDNNCNGLTDENALTSSPGAANITWTGAIDTDWSKPCNWNPAWVPDATSPVIIPNVSNAPSIAAGTAAQAYSVNVQSGASLTIAATATLTINGFLSTTNTSSLLNQGTVTNSGRLIIGSTPTGRQFGLWNLGTFTNNSSGEINIDNCTGNGINNNQGSFFNTGKINIGATASVGDFGIENQQLAVFNNTGGEIKIRRSNTAGVLNGLGSTFTNAAVIDIGATASAGVYGIINQSTFNNNADGDIRIDNVTSDGFYNFSGTFTNRAKVMVVATGITYALENAGTVENVSCGMFIANSGTFQNKSFGTITNGGLIQVAATLENTGTFTNNGTLKYGSLTGTVTSNQNSSIIVNNSIPIFTYGGVYNGAGASTVNGIYKEQEATNPAGVFTAPNTFVPDASLPLGTQTLYAKITPSGASCSYVVPFSYDNVPVGRPFITRWDLSKPGSGANQLSIGVATAGTVNYTWTTVPAGTSGSGTFNGTTLTISGLPTNAVIDLSIDPTNFQRIINGTSRERLVQIKQWGDVAWTSMERAFSGCSNMILMATDVPNLTGVTNMRSMFQDCSSFNQALPEGFNTATVENMSDMFWGCSRYDQPLPSSFNTSSVTDMRQMFGNCSVYNQPLPTSFNTSSVTDMRYMFGNCSVYNQPLPSSFNTSSVIDMSQMFSNCSSYNKELPSSFNTSSVIDMSQMFSNCSSYNQPLPSSFNTSS